MTRAQLRILPKSWYAAERICTNVNNSFENPACEKKREKGFGVPESPKPNPNKRLNVDNSISVVSYKIVSFVSEASKVYLHHLSFWLFSLNVI